MTFEKLALIDGDYFLCDYKDAAEIANVVEELDLTLADKYTFSIAPASIRKNGNVDTRTIYGFALDRAKGRKSELKNYISPPRTVPQTVDALKVLEGVHKDIILYMWLG